jgi:hypothetical protein
MFTPDILDGFDNDYDACFQNDCNCHSYEASYQPMLDCHGNVHPEAFPDIKAMAGLGCYSQMDVYKNGVLIGVGLAFAGALRLVKSGKAKFKDSSSIEVG